MICAVLLSLPLETVVDDTAKVLIFEQITTGCGAVRDWNGIERFTSYSSEQEALFQRGTRMRITKVNQEGSKTYIDCEVIGQELKDLSYVRDSNIGY